MPKFSTPKVSYYTVDSMAVLIRKRCHRLGGDLPLLLGLKFDSFVSNLLIINIFIKNTEVTYLLMRPSAIIDLPVLQLGRYSSKISYVDIT